MCIRDRDSDGLLEESELPSRVWSKWTEAGVDANDDGGISSVSYTHLRAHETVLDLVCRLLLEKKKNKTTQYTICNIHIHTTNISSNEHVKTRTITE